MDTTQPQAASTPPSDGAPPLAGLPGGAPISVRDAADGQKGDAAGERSALDWLCGATAPLRYTVDVQYATPDGIKPLRFHMHQLDVSQLDAIERRNRKGDGPFADLVTRTYNAEVVAEATDLIEDLGNGQSLSIREPRFLGAIPSPPIAVEKRFGYQPGLLRGLVSEVREMAGDSADRVGTAQRALVDAAGNS